MHNRVGGVFTRQRWLVLFLGAALAGLLFTGCGKQQPAADTSSPQADTHSLAGKEAEEEEEQVQDGSLTMLHTEAELDAIRQSLPYRGEPELYSSSETNRYPVYSDPQSVQMADFLMQIVARGTFPAHSFEEPKAAPAEYVLQVALQATPPLSSQGWEEAYRVFYIEQLLDLEQYVTGADRFYTKEHVAATARAIFGDEVPIRHQQTSLFGYAAYTGLYWPLEVNYLDYRPYLPVLVSRRDLGDRWELEVVYLHSSLHGRWVDLFGAELEPDEFETYVQQPWLPRHTITLVKAEGGGFTYYAHILPEQPLTATYAARQQAGFSFSATDLLGVVPCPDGQLPQWSEAVYRSESLVLDEDGSLLYLFPVYHGASLSVEKLDWTLGSPAVTDTVLYYAPDQVAQHGFVGQDNADYALAIRVHLPAEGEQPAYRAVVALGGKRVEYPLVQGAVAEGVAVLAGQEQDKPQTAG